MVFLLILIIIILMLVTIKIKIKFENFIFKSENKEHLNKNYKIEIYICTLKIIPILKIKITNDKIKKVFTNEKIKKIINEEKTKIIENKNDIDIKAIKNLKNIKIEISEMDLKIFIGTENASTTAFIIPIISTVIAIFLSKKIEKYNEKQVFSIQPIYNNHNLINIEFSGIFQIKMIHIINTICIIKKRKGDKNERASNRRAYGYSYE